MQTTSLDIKFKLKEKKNLMKHTQFEGTQNLYYKMPIQTTSLYKTISNRPSTQNFGHRASMGNLRSK